MLRNVARRFYSSHNKIILSKDESCFLAVHPDIEHEYKYTKPLPKAEVTKGTLLKVDSRNMITKSPNLEQIQTLTFTPARYWMQFPGREKRKKHKEFFDDKEDRKGLTS